MGRENFRLVLAILIFSTMLCSISGPAFAATEKNEAMKSYSIGTVNLKKDVKAEISNLVLVPSNNGQLLGVTLTIHNNGDTEFDSVDYWLEIHSKSGTKYSISIANDVKKITAKTAQDLIFYSQVGSEVKYSDLVFHLVQWDFSYDNFRKVIGKIEVPSSYNPITAGTSNRLIAAGDTRLSLAVVQANIGQSEKYYRPNLRLKIKNVGKQALTLPDYEFTILTGNGLNYPLTVKNIKGTLLNPLSEEEFQLTSSIPSEANKEQWKMVVFLPINDGAKKVPIAIFDLPETKVTGGDDIGKFYTFTTIDGIYEVRLDSLNRLPLEDNDLIIANMTLKNASNETLPIPEFSGKFLFNNTIEKPGAVSTNNKMVGLLPGEQVQIQAVSSIPYTFATNDVKFTLQQKDESEVVDLVQFENGGKFNSIPLVKVDQLYNIDDVGYRSELKINHLMTFGGSNANIVAAQINVKNMESRSTDLQKLAGYFENEDGTVYNATFENIKEKLSPGGNAILYAWATLPKNVPTDNLKLVIGKAVENNTGTETQLMGYVNASLFELPPEKEIQKHLQQIDLHPYQLSIRRVTSQYKYVSSPQAIFDIEYTLTKDLLTKANTDEQRIVIEISDNYSDAVYSQTFNFPEAGAASGSALELGNNSFRMIWDDEKDMDAITSFKDYNINIYLEFKSGYKKLLATETIPWLVSRSLN